MDGIFFRATHAWPPDLYSATCSVALLPCPVVACLQSLFSVDAVVSILCLNCCSVQRHAVQCKTVLVHRACTMPCGGVGGACSIKSLSREEGGLWDGWMWQNICLARWVPFQ